MDSTEQVNELTPETTGVWAVRTQGSLHIWDLDNMRYARFPDESSMGVGFPDEFNAKWWGIRRVGHWPAVDDSFVVYPAGMIDRHMSSKIRSITRFVGTLGPRD